MKLNSSRILVIFSLVFLFALTTFANPGRPAITWYPKEFTCPIDDQNNTFMVIGSYGSYIYNYPSKYQWLFFPNTSANNFYMCKKCHLTTYMWDFDKRPKEKIPALRKLLSSVKFERKFKMYNEVPVSERLEVMEKVYRVLGKKNSWWENFHRIRGFHYGLEGNKLKATEERKLSLDMISKEIALQRTANTKIVKPLKLFLYISASMKHFLNDDDGALKDLETALGVKYEESGLDESKAKSAEAGLNERIKDYIKQIKSEISPRMAEENKRSHP